MFSFTVLLTDLQAAIAARAARDRALTVLLVAVWARIARMRTRLERLIALWRAGKLPSPRAPRGDVTRVNGPRGTPQITFPTTPGWLLRRLGFEVAAYGSQLQHVLTEAECQAFLAAVPQAGRLLRPLLRMLTADPLPEVVRKVTPAMPAPATQIARAGILVSPRIHFLDA